MRGRLVFWVETATTLQLFFGVLSLGLRLETLDLENWEGTPLKLFMQVMRKQCRLSPSVSRFEFSVFEFLRCRWLRVSPPPAGERCLLRRSNSHIFGCFGCSSWLVHTWQTQFNLFTRPCALFRPTVCFTNQQLVLYIQLLHDFNQGN